jgi:hypothetical protein
MVIISHSSGLTENCLPCSYSKSWGTGWKSTHKTACDATLYSKTGANCKLRTDCNCDNSQVANNLAGRRALKAKPASQTGFMCLGSGFSAHETALVSRSQQTHIEYD